ncbi:neuronal growth regulator 1 [Elysia marginata]|uniref:Neuronal growth regulator 1 n=1 Tax=Elysia marginata TaxID=1093978 RepID=A0AAV4ERV7_9GAST|nr:neuronal growth regulator 1 [Elysia marginata]
MFDLNQLLLKAKTFFRSRGVDFIRIPLYFKDISRQYTRFTRKLVHRNPEIVDEIWPEVQPIGRTARINCTIAKLKDHEVQWYHKDSKQVIAIGESINVDNPRIGSLKKYDIRVRAKGDRHTYMLVINRLRQQDSGTYECRVAIRNTAQGTWPRKLGELTVQVAPTIKLGDTSAVLQVDRYQNTSLECAAMGIPEPNITWTRSDGGLLPVLPLPVAQYRGKKLPLVNVDIQHMGVYRCVADNNIKPPAEHLAEVLVFHAPNTRVVQNSVGQAQNRRFSAKLECIVRGHPQPTVTWERMVDKGRFLINDDDKFDINKQTTDNQNLKAMEQWYSLKVKNVQANDFTAYYCRAGNRYGNHSSQIDLFETTECQGSNCPSLPPSAGSLVTLSTMLLLLPALVSLSLHV